MNRYLLLVIVPFTVISGFGQCQLNKSDIRIKLKNKTEDVKVIKKADYDSVRIIKKLGVKIYTGNKSEDYLYSQAEIDLDFTPEGPGITDDEENKNKNEQAWGKEVCRLEYPHLNADRATNKVLVKYADGDLGVNYSLEWDCKKRANRWTCYELNKTNGKQIVPRKDAFCEDEELPAKARTTLEEYKNTGSVFDRGHLCPSGDRRASELQQKQTYYLTNMQPQYQKHNRGVWSKLEQLVRSWVIGGSHAKSVTDTLYVVKAATIDRLLPQGTHPTMVVPKYFYMAILAKTNGKYHAIALWTRHVPDAKTRANKGDYAITIEELQKRTGLDFFCNLPDNVEKTVEGKIDYKFWNLRPGDGREEYDGD